MGLGRRPTCCGSTSRGETESLFVMRDRFLRQVVALLEPQWVVGVGAFAEQRARNVLGTRVQIGRIPHPSPASPAANLGWERLADEAFAGLGLAD